MKRGDDVTNIVNNYCSTIVTIFQSVIQAYENNKDNIKRIEEELSDVEHEIELGESRDMYKGWLLYKEIKDLRTERRRCKEENELLKDMYDYLNSPQGQQFKNKIQQIQGSSVKIAKVQENRTYTPKQRSDLTITDKHSEAHRPFEELLADFKKVKVHKEGGKLRK